MKKKLLLYYQSRGGLVQEDDAGLVNNIHSNAYSPLLAARYASSFVITNTSVGTTFQAQQRYDLLHCGILLCATFVLAKQVSCIANRFSDC